jgi:hypothetical protein
MQLEFAFLADAATLQDNGLFAVVSGGFDVVESAQFPAIKYAMALIGRLRFDPEECGKTYTIKAEIISPTGVPLGADVAPALVIQFHQFPHPRDSKRSNVTTFCFNYQGVGFPVPGTYAIYLSEGNQVIGQVAIDVIQKEGAS